MRFAIGFLVQVVPCAVLCVWPFANHFRGERRRACVGVAAFIAIWDVLFTLAAAGPLSHVPLNTSLLLQNVLFFIALAVLLGIFVYTVDASAPQKLFVFLLVMCFGYAVTQLGDAIAGAIDLPVADKERLYDPAGLIAMALCTAVLLAPMIALMNRVRALLALPVAERSWLGMDATLAGALVVLMVFEIVPKFYQAPYSQDAFLSASLALGAAGLLAATYYIARTGAIEARRRNELAQTLMAHERKAEAAADKLQSARLRITELEGTVAEMQAETEALKRAMRERAVTEVKGTGAGADAPADGSVSARPSASVPAEGERSADLDFEKPIVLASGNSAVRFFASDVLYIESLKRVRVAHLENGETFRVGVALSQLIDMLPAGRFIYCHRSIVVNLDHVRELGADTLTLTDGTELPVGRRRVPEVRAALEARGRR